MQIFASPTALTILFLAGCYVLFATRKHQNTVTVALVITAVTLCITVIGSMMTWPDGP
jgi:multisubunit Na+/H+ antiporter MnhC subunit